MKKIIFYLSSIFLILSFSLITPFSVKAQDNNELDEICTILINGTPAITSSDANEPPAGVIPVSSSIGFSGNAATYPVIVQLSPGALETLNNCSITPFPPLQLATLTGFGNSFENTSLTYNGRGEYTTSFDVLWNFDQNYTVAVDVETPSGGSCQNQLPICRRAYIRLAPTSIENFEQSCQRAKSTLTDIVTEAIESSYRLDEPLNVSIDSSAIASVLNSCTGQFARMEVFSVETGERVSFSTTSTGASNLILNFANNQVGNYSIVLAILNDNGCSLNDANCRTYYVSKNYCVYLPNQETCTPLTTDTTTGDNTFTPTAFQLCEQIPETAANLGTSKKTACITCFNNSGIWTAIGCIPQNPAQAVAVLVKIFIGIAGGVALIMILAAGFMFTTSQGEANKLNEAKELMQSAVIGLLFVIFSVTILQFIGSDILQIPGFGGN